MRYILANIQARYVMFSCFTLPALTPVLLVTAIPNAIADLVLEDLQVEAAAPEGQQLAAPQSVVMPSADTPICSASQTTAWQETWDVGQGVDAFDPEGHRIGFYAAIKDAWLQGKNWYPWMATNTASAACCTSSISMTPGLRGMRRTGTTSSFRQSHTAS
jgi:hypothetical protein